MNLFNFPFFNSPSLKKVSLKFIALEKLYSAKQNEKIMLLNKLDDIDLFLGDPFAEIEAMKKLLIDENISFVPTLDIDLDDKELAARFSIYYNDLIASFGTSADSLSNVGWMRCYKKMVRDSGEPLLFKAFYRVYSNHFMVGEKNKLVFRNGALPFYEGYLKCIGADDITKKWSDNLEAIAHIDSMKKAHVDNARQAAHKAQQAAFTPQFSEG